MYRYRYIFTFLFICFLIAAGGALYGYKTNQRAEKETVPAVAQGEQAFEQEVPEAETTEAAPVQVSAASSNAISAVSASAPTPFAVPAGLEVLEIDPMVEQQWISLDDSSRSLRRVEPKIERTANGYRIKIHIPGMTCVSDEREGTLFQHLTISGWSMLTKLGSPAVPAKNILLSLPEGIEPSVTVAALSEILVQPLKIFPAQRLPMDLSPEPAPEGFELDPAVYGGQTWYPADTIVETQIGRMRNKRILTITVAPVRALPSEDAALVAEDIELEVVFNPIEAGDGDGAMYEPLGDDMERYMVLMDDQYATNAQLLSFMDWKRRKGYEVVPVLTSEINASGAPTSSEIIDYMRALPAADYPEYLLVIGDHTAANGVQGYYYSTYYGGYSDLYMACRDAGDYYPDLYTGRLPATNNASLNLMLDKVMAMDRNPPDTAMFDRVCVAGQIQDYQDSYPNEADRLFCETADSIACYFEQDAGGVDYFCQRAVVNPNSVNASCYWNQHHSPASLVWDIGDQIGNRIYTNFVSVAEARSRLFTLINGGIALLQHRDHGAVTGWGDPNFRSSDVRTLTNGLQRPVVFSINCLTGSYDEHDNFTRAWLEHVNGGAYAVFSPTDVSYSWLNDWLTHGFYAGFLSDYISWHNASMAPNWPQDLPNPGGAYGAAGSAQRLGQILNFGKMYMGEHYSYDLDTFLLFHVFGDPETFLQLHTPADPNVTHSTAVGVGVATVSVSTGREGSRVALYSEALGVHESTNTDSSGTAQLVIDTPMTGQVYVTVTELGYEPYEGVVEVGGSVIRFGQTQLDLQEDAGMLQVPVYREGETDVAVGADFAAVNGSALSGSDYTASSGYLSFGIGVTSQTIQVSIIDDGNDESWEDFQLVLSNPTTDTVFGVVSNLTIQIEDNDGPGELFLVGADRVVPEAVGSFDVTVLRRNGSDGAVSVQYRTAAGTASGGSDYTAVTGTVNLAAGVDSNTFSISVISDVQEEPDETFYVQLFNFSSASVGGLTNQVVEITNDDDAGVVMLGSASIQTHETNSSVTIEVIRTGGYDGSVSFDYATADGTATAGQDYESLSGFVNMGDQVSNTTLEVTLLDDVIPEQGETFTMTLSNPTGGLQLGDPAQCTVTIESDERPKAPFPFVEDFEATTLSNCWSTYSSEPGRVQLTTSYSPHGGVRHVTMDTVSGLAVNELILCVDMTGKEQVHLSFWHKEFGDEDQALPTSFVGHYNGDGVSISVDGTNWYRVTSLTSAEGINSSYKQFDLLLDTVMTANGLTYNDEVQIKFQQYDDYAISTDGFAFDDIALYQRQGQLGFAESAAALVEANTAVTLMVQRVEGDYDDVSVQYNTVNGTAMAGSDYTAISGTLPFADGETVKPLVVPILADGADENDEVFSVVLSNPGNGAGLGDITQCDVTIRDDEGAGTLGFDGVTWSTFEDGASAAVKVIRTDGFAGSVSVQYASSNGTALAASDYTAASGSLTFPSGVCTQWVNVTLVNDDVTEADEDFFLALSSPGGGAGLSTNDNAQVIIVDDDYPRASLPFTENFETSALAGYWSTYTSTTNGRVQISTLNTPYEGTRHFLMDSVNYSMTCGELELRVEVQGWTDLELSFWHKEFGDEDHTMPTSFVGHALADGVAISVDGTNWYKAQGLCGIDGISSTYRNFTVDLMALLEAHDLTPGRDLLLRFQHYDDYYISTDGFAFDLIALTGTLEDDMQVTPDDDWGLWGYEGGPFDSSSRVYTVENSGTASLDWSVGNAAPWLQVSTSGGSLAPLASANVTVSLTAAAAGLSPGSYEDYVVFSNESSGVARSCRVGLTVEEVPEPPPTPFNPDPADTATDVDLDSDLSWNNEVEFRNPRTDEKIAEIMATMTVDAEGEQAGVPSVGRFAAADFEGRDSQEIEILAFVGHSDNRAGGEYENTLNAIAQFFTNFNVTTTTSEDPGVLQTELSTADVFLIPEQESWTLSSMSAFGSTLSGVLSNFMNAGGVVIVCDFSPSGGGAAFVTQAGLMTATAGSISSDRSATVIVSNELTEGVGTSFTICNGSTTYGSISNAEVLVELQGQSLPMVANRSIGAGGVVLLGMDFFQYNDDMARLIANAVNWTGGGIKTYYNVWFDTVNPPWQQVETDSRVAQAELDRLASGETYYWQVVASNAVGTVTGPVWRFTTRFVGALEVLDSVAPTGDRSVPMGDVIIGLSGTEQIELRNTNALYDLTVSAISSLSNEFSLVGAPALPCTITPNTSRVFSVRYTPTAEGLSQATLTLTSDDEDEPVVEVALSATGIRDYLAITPETTWLSRGHPGGPFTPDEYVYVLSNNGPVACSWTASPGATWLSVAPVGGTVPSGQSQTVTARLTSVATTLPEASYAGSVVFSNLTTTMVQMCPATLEVYTSPHATLQPTEIYVTNLISASSSVWLRVGNEGDADLDYQLRSRETSRVIMGDGAAAGDVVELIDGIEFRCEFAQPEIIRKPGNDQVWLPETERYIRPGCPIVPTKPLTFLVPPGYQVTDIQVFADDSVVLGEGCYLPPAEMPYPLSRPDLAQDAVPNAAVYGGGQSWPGKTWEDVGPQIKRGYRLYRLNLFPVEFESNAGRLSYRPAISVRVHWAPTGQEAPTARRDVALEERLQQQVINPAILNSYPEKEVAVDEASDLPAGGPYDFVVITSEALEAAPGPYNFQALCAAKQARGVRAGIVTLNYIYANYDGTRPDGGSDNQTRIRNFLMDAYENWGTRYALMGGDESTVPARKFWVQASSYTTEMPVDMYYGCVDPAACTFDYDADGLYGEPTDGVDGADVDLYGEVYIGRAAVENDVELSNFIRKTLAYEQSGDEYLNQVSMVGEHLGFGGVAEYAKTMMEQIRTGGYFDNYFTYGFTNYLRTDLIEFCLTNNIYDEEGSWPKSELLTRMNGGVHVINHLGHANSTYCMKLYVSDLAGLTNDRTFFAYSQGCQPGWFDSNDCFAEEITAMEHGAFAVVMNARYGWGTRDSTDGPSQRFDRQFWDAMLGEEMPEIGRMNQDSKEDNIWDINGSCIRWCFYELNLFGDPELSFRFTEGCDWVTMDPDTGTVVPGATNPVEAVFSSGDLQPGQYDGEIMMQGNDVDQPVLTIPIHMTILADALSFSPNDELNASGVRGGPFAPAEQVYSLINSGAVAVAWSVSESADWLEVVPASGTLNAGGQVTFTARIAAVASTLPAAAYETALVLSNHNSGVVQTRNAFLTIDPPPPETIAIENLDADPGWITENQWAFGCPSGAGSHNCDPFSGHTGTNVYGFNLNGDYSNSMSRYYLTSLAFDCSDYENIILRFWRWLGVENSSYDHAGVEVSNDGTNWVSVWEHTGSSFSDSTWQEMEYELPDIADDCTTVYLRWAMGHTDGSVTYPGWNIDDIRLEGNAMDDLSLVPGDEFSALAVQGGPFYPAGREYFLRNLGAESIGWVVDCDAAWLDIQPVSGTLAMGEYESITVDFNTVAEQLEPGTYTTEVRLSNTVSGFVFVRPVQVEIRPVGYNMLRNGSFEEQASTIYKARSWEWGQPDSHGGVWGTASRETWRHYPDEDGAWSATICGSWKGENGGGWWQDAAVMPGETYRLSGWFWKDVDPPYGPWTSRNAAVKFEFWAEETGSANHLAVYTGKIHHISQAWQYLTLEGVAPAGAKWGRVVVYADGLADAGALQFDDLHMEWVTQHDAVRYVSRSGSHEAPFTSWSTAATNIQAAVDAAGDGNTVWVTNGVYQLDRPIFVPRGSVLRSVNGPDVTILDGQDACRVIQLGCADAVLDGFTITNGAASGEYPDSLGGGVMLNRGGEVRNCVISGNASDQHGGGVGGYLGGTVVDCQVLGNMAINGGGGVYFEAEGHMDGVVLSGNHADSGGGGKFTDATGTVYGCTIQDNTSPNGGSAMDCSRSSLQFENCRITGNSGGWAGGLVFWANGTYENVEVNIQNTVFGNNSGGGGGGAIACGVTAHLRNVSFYNNTSSWDAGGFSSIGGSAVTMENCVLWGNSSPQVFGSPSISYSCIQNGYSGTGNIASDPLFNTTTWELGLGSPCVDTALDVDSLNIERDGPSTPLATDLNGVPRPLDGDDNGAAGLDMGALEFVHPTADTDHDGLSDASEIDAYGTSPIIGDTDGDGQLDGSEIICGTDPHDENGYFTCGSECDATNSTFQIAWQSATGRTYCVQTRESFTSTWQNVSGHAELAGTGAIMQRDVAYPASTTCYFRVQVRMTNP